MYGVYIYLLTFRLIKLTHYLISPRSLLDAQIMVAKSRLLEAIVAMDEGLKSDWYKHPPSSLKDHLINVRSWAANEKNYL